MAAILPKSATYEDLFDLPEHVVGEIIGGRIVTHPRPAPRHVLAYSQLGRRIGGPFDDGINGPGGWWILDEPELHLQSGDILVPDLAGWRRVRMPELPQKAWFEVVPDWICEILSPSTARVDRAEKLPIYAAAGVVHVWLVDPDARTLEVFANQGGPNQGGRWLLLTVLDNDANVAQPPFAEVGFNLASLWAE